MTSIFFSNASPSIGNHESKAINSCQIALIPHRGDLRADQKISTYQKKVFLANDAEPYLENLAWAYIQKARESFDEGFYLLAQHAADCIRERDAESLSALLITGHVHHSMHEFKRAEAVARQLIDERGQWFDYALLGDVLMEQGHLEDAVEAYRAMMELRPGPQAYSRAAHLRWLTGDLDGAIQLMSMVAQSTHHIDRETLAWSLSRLSLYELQAKRYVKATAHAQTALTLFPDYAPAHLVLSRIYLAQQNWDNAIQHADNAVAIYPQVEPLWVLYEAYSAAGHGKSAVEVQERLTQSGKVDDPRTYSLYLSTVNDRTLNTQTANAQTKVALDLAHQELLDRTDVHTLDALAWALTAAGFHQQAYDIGKKVVKENTQDARFFYHLSVIAERAGHTDEALKWRDKALQLQHMLLPSEKTHLDTEFATIPLQKPQLTAAMLSAN